jgi:hypothetical protein
METKSIYSRGGSGMTTGGLDAYLGPDASDYSSLPSSIEEPKAAEDVREVDCSVNSSEPVCQIAEAEKQMQANREVDTKASNGK